MRTVLLALRGGLVYESDGNFGRAVHPIPVLTRATGEWIRAGVAAGCGSLLFREDSFDPVTRIRRGRLYLYDDSRGAGSIPPENVSNYPFGRHVGVEGGWTPDCWYRNVQQADLVHKGCLEGLQVNLGEGDFETLWRVVGVERVSTGDLLFTLRALSSLGALPILTDKLSALNGDLVDTGPIREALDQVVTAFHVQQSRPIVDVCWETARVILAAWVGAAAQKQDLGSLIFEIQKTGEKPVGVTAAALIVNRLHPRGKSAEREKQAARGKNLRPIIDEDAETSVQLIGLILRDIGWAAA